MVDEKLKSTLDKTGKPNYKLQSDNLNHNVSIAYQNKTFPSQF